MEGRKEWRGEGEQGQYRRVFCRVIRYSAIVVVVVVKKLLEITCIRTDK